MSSVARPFPLSYAYSDGWMKTGRVTGCNPQSITVCMPGLSVGTIVDIETSGRRLHCEVRSVAGSEAVCTPFEPFHHINVGTQATSTGAVLGAYCGPGLLGQCVDAWGRGSERGAGVTQAKRMRPLALGERRPVSIALSTGTAAIDALCMMGQGQRVALFSGAGVGKSTLLRQIAERAELDAHVVALIGERGREAAEAVTELRASRRWERTTVVCATAEASPRERFAAARTALAQAEWLADHGNDVLLTIDSLTRVANAWRELALASGEAAAHRGHPASMIGALASIVERAGARANGSITGIFAVLVDGDDPFEPVTDAVRGLLDGHIVLSRRLSEAASYPPIDVLRSSSRLMGALCSEQQLADAALVRKALAALERAEDLFAIGAYRPGGDLLLDAAVAQRDRLNDFLFHGRACVNDALGRLHEIAQALRAATGP